MSNQGHPPLAKDDRRELGGVIRKLRAWLPKKEARLVEGLVPGEGAPQE